MVLSENGWPAVRDTSTLTRFTAAGQGFWAASDDVAVCLGEYIQRFNDEVEPVKGPILDDWSYANRLVRGSDDVVSNHGSATAADLNSLQHPRGVHGTFSDRERGVCHRIRDSISDDNGRTVLRLGMDYKSTPDDMHVEIAPGAGPARVKQAANKIRARRRAEQEAREMAELKINPDSDQWAEHKHTASDVEANPGLKKGGTSAWSSLLRFPPAVERVRRELTALGQAIRGDITSTRADVMAVKGQSQSNGGQLSSLREEVKALTALVQQLVDAQTPKQ